jgi:elongation factor P--(R)-beta-lysine ligase
MTIETERDRLWDRLENLGLRSRALTALRGFFEARGYLEVETPQRVRSPGMELHLCAVEASGWWLNTSPEYQMKRLVAGGMERIYQVCHAFRDEERGPHHVTEFTLCEWYRVGASITELMEETELLISHVARSVLGRTTVIGPDGDEVELDPASGWERLTVREAVWQYAGIELDGTESGSVLAERARRAGLCMPTDAVGWDEVFTRILVDAVEPRLGRTRPTILHRYPARQAALAQLCPDDPRFAERFEVYAGGLELANAFGELTDAAEQRRRLETDRAARRDLALEDHPLDERFLAALEQGMPPTSGIALGVDRLVMLLCGASRIDDVLTFTPEDL